MARPEPLVVRAMRAYKARLLVQESSQMWEMATRWLRVEASLGGQIEALAREAAEMVARGESVSRSRVYRLERARRLLAQAIGEVDRYADYAGHLITSQQLALARQGINDAAQAIQLSYLEQGMRGVRATFDRLPFEAVETMIGLAGDGAPVGNLLRRRMVRDADGTPLPGVWDRLVDSLVNGTAQGWNPRKTARYMRDDLAAALQKALLIARTEQLRVYRLAGLEQYRTSGVVRAQKRLSAHDGRVCPACIADDGTLYDLDAIIPDHPQGRCTGVPIVDGLPEVNWLSGEDWFRAQDEAVQRSILGGGLFDAWAEGAFDFGDLVRRTFDDVWGGGVQPRSLQDLVD